MPEATESAVKNHLSTAPAEGLAVMAEVMRDLTSARRLDEVIATITTATRKLVGADGVTFILREGTMCHYVDESAIAPLWKGKRFPDADCVSGWCMRNRQSVIIPDVLADPRIPRDLYINTFVRSLAMVPIRANAPMAALGAYWGTHTEATPEHMVTLEMLANGASLAIDHLDLRHSRDETKAAVQHQRLLLAELSHRVKDTLAVVQSLALQTLRGSSSLEVFRDKFLGRLQAVGAAHALLLREDWRGVELADLIEQSVRPFKGSAIIRDGANAALFLTPKAHLALSMILHELGANASRHGGLVRKGMHTTGSVAVSWVITDDDNVTLSWNETGIARNVDVSEQGFGLSLVNRLVELELSGTYSLECGPSRLSITLTFPLRYNVQQPSNTPNVDLRKSGASSQGSPQGDSTRGSYSIDC